MNHILFLQPSIGREIPTMLVVVIGRVSLFRPIPSCQLTIDQSSDIQSFLVKFNSVLKGNTSLWTTGAKK